MKRDKKFEDAYKNLTIEGWYNWLNGKNYPKQPKEIFWAYMDNEEILKEYIVAFEKRFNKKLKYRLDELAYISYV